MKTLLTTLFIMTFAVVLGQDKIQIKGTVLDAKTSETIKNYTVEYFSVSHKVLNTVHPESDGTFTLTLAYEDTDKFYFIVKSAGFIDNKKAIRMQRYEPDSEIELTFYLSR